MQHLNNYLGLLVIIKISHFDDSKKPLAKTLSKKSLVKTLREIPYDYQ